MYTNALVCVRTLSYVYKRSRVRTNALASSTPGAPGHGVDIACAFKLTKVSALQRGIVVLSLLECLAQTANAGERWAAGRLRLCARSKRSQTQESVGWLHLRARSECKRRRAPGGFVWSERSSGASLKLLPRKIARKGLTLSHALPQTL